MRNLVRVVAFDVLAPLGAVLALVYIGVALAWPLWWVSVCSVLCLLIVQAVVVDVVLWRRDGVTLGTDDDAPRLRLAAVGLTTVALAAAVAVGYTSWTAPQSQLNRDMTEVVGIASSAAEASATFTPQNPSANVDRLTAMMTSRGADVFRGEFDSMAKDLTSKGLTVSASTVSAGVEAIGPEAAVVAVVMRGTQNAPGKQPATVPLPLRVSLVKQDGRWLVDDLSPINSR
ncbi:hypothetical protein H7K45_28970 [Mycobacterium yunnanensis]|uniref:Mce-associated membrane protein n=1 Tax=Mycobacterium yunnanensis TaxID=368477 RepID=A0A9X3BWE4_9MYCO|nr:hypothetical protein [Mycobacterium yunnanensis]MCV7424579.1 hypothetical protein [Mycobacterium yunnanensis]